MTFDPRDELWKVSFETFYDTYYEEIAADKIINRWQLIDEISKAIVALTASGSAVSGWALWSDPNYKSVWAILAGIGAILAILHSTLGVPNRLKDWGEVKRMFATLRIDLETFRYQMTVDPEFPLKEFNNEFIGHRRRYGEGVQRIKNDVLWTNGLEKKAQKELNFRLGNASK